MRDKDTSYYSVVYTNTLFTRVLRDSMCCCAGLVEIEEGELTGQQLNLQTHALARISFAKKPHVQQVNCDAQVLRHALLL